MADDKKMMEVDGVLKDTVVTIEIETNLHTRLAQLLMEQALSMGVTNFAKFFDEMDTREPKNNAEYHLYTMLMIVERIESKYKEDGKIVKMEIPDNHSDDAKASDSSDASETPVEN